MELSEIYQELIIDHGTNPRNYCFLKKASHCAEGHNPLCGDKVKVFMRIEKDIIKEISFQGAGCAISTASASIMTEMLQGKTKGEAMELFAAFKELVTKESTDVPCCNLGKLLALASVKAFPNRIKCATLAWHTLEDAIK